MHPSSTPVFGQRRDRSALHGLRPHRLRLQGLIAAAAIGLAAIQPAAARTAAGHGDTAPAESRKHEFTITVTEQGFDPADIALKRGEPARLTFIRTSEKTCATEVRIPALRVRRPLPLNAKVAIQFTPRETGDLTFTCGQQMFKGTLVVE